MRPKAKGNKLIQEFMWLNTQANVLYKELVCSGK